MWPYPHVPADLVAITEKILNGKLHFSCSDITAPCTCIKSSIYLLVSATFVTFVCLLPQWTRPDHYPFNHSYQILYQLFLSHYYSVATQVTPNKDGFELVVSVSPSYSLQLLLSVTHKKYSLLLLTVSASR